MTPERSRRLDELFEEARQREPAEREAFVAAACGDDHALRAELERLLGADAAPPEEPRDPTTTDDARAGPWGAQPEAEQAVPEVIGPYRILQVLGEGGMGVVYLAEQTEPVRRRVALKIIKLGMDTRQVIARFEAEQQALALMNHPCVARVLDAGVTEQGRPYFVMEYVPGVAITDHCDRQRLTIEERLELFMQVCEAVQHAHQKGIIHRDIKPSNILVTPSGDRVVPKVIDFGVAKAMNQPLTERTLFTQHGQMIGTPEYMSPEQAELTAQDVDTRTDIYALGVLLYELLTGERPFSSETMRHAGLAEIQRIIREVDPPKPSTRLASLGDQSTTHAASRRADPTTLTRNLRGDLDWIVMKTLEKDRSRRYETAAALAEDVHRHLRYEPVVAGPPGLRYRARKFVRRNRFAVAAATAVSLVLIAGIAGTTWGLLAAQEQAVIAAGARDAERDAKGIAQARARDAEAALAEQRRSEATSADLAQEVWRNLREGRVHDFPSMLESASVAEVGERWKRADEIAAAAAKHKDEGAHGDAARDFIRAIGAWQEGDKQLTTTTTTIVADLMARDLDQLSRKEVQALLSEVAVVRRELLASGDEKGARELQEPFGRMLDRLKHQPKLPPGDRAPQRAFETTEDGEAGTPSVPLYEGARLEVVYARSGAAVTTGRFDVVGGDRGEVRLVDVGSGDELEAPTIVSWTLIRNGEGAPAELATTNVGGVGPSWFFVPSLAGDVDAVTLREAYKTLEMLSFALPGQPRIRWPAARRLSRLVEQIPAVEATVTRDVERLTARFTTLPPAEQLAAMSTSDLGFSRRLWSMARPVPTGGEPDHSTIDTLRTALESTVTARGEDHTATQTLVQWIADELEAAGRGDEAIAFRRRNASISRARDGERSAMPASATMTLARALVRESRWKEAEDVLAQSLRALKPNDPVHAVVIARQLAEVHREQSDWEAAASVLHAAVPLALAKDFLVGSLASALAETYEAWGKPELAAEWRAASDGASGDMTEVTVNPTPDNCDVIIGGVFVGNTPYVHAVRSGGEIELRLEKAGYEPWVRLISPTSALEITPDLEPSGSP